LVYAVCTLTKSETTKIADTFTAEHPDYIPDPVFASNATAAAGPSQVHLWPHEINGNGMFIAAWRRKA
jgi:16S rRNA (cytosine967-C5)-methyltransferase